MDKVGRGGSSLIAADNAETNRVSFVIIFMYFFYSSFLPLAFQFFETFIATNNFSSSTALLGSPSVFWRTSLMLYLLKSKTYTPRTNRCILLYLVFSSFLFFLLTPPSLKDIWSTILKRYLIRHLYFSLHSLF